MRLIKCSILPRAAQTSRQRKDLTWDSNTSKNKWKSKKVIIMDFREMIRLMSWHYSSLLIRKRRRELQEQSKENFKHHPPDSLVFMSLQQSSLKILDNRFFNKITLKWFTRLISTPKWYLYQSACSTAGRKFFRTLFIFNKNKPKIIRWVILSIQAHK